jgi:hypothetical protein
MVQCQCIKGDGNQCTRQAVTNKPDKRFCWQHQKCKKIASGASTDVVSSSAQKKTPVMKAAKKKKTSIQYKKCAGKGSKNQVCDPLTGKWIEKCGSKYQTLVENEIIDGKGNIITHKTPTPSPPKPTSSGKLLCKLVKYKYPIEVNYQPLSKHKLPKAKCNIDGIREWLSRPEVRVNLLSKMNLTIYGNYFAKGNQSIEEVTIYDSPYEEEYTDYIQDVLIKAVMADMEGKGITSNETNEGDFLRVLFKAGLGYLVPTKNDYLLVLNLSFPHSKITAVPDDGNCYYWSVGANIGKVDQEIRDDMAVELGSMDPSDYESIVSNSLQTCPGNSTYAKAYKANKAKFLKEYLDLIKIPCGPDMLDCNDCIWGGNHFDSVMVDMYKVPVLGIGLGIGGGFKMSNDTEIDLDELSEDMATAGHFLELVEVENSQYWDDMEEEYVDYTREYVEAHDYPLVMSLQYTVEPQYYSPESAMENYLNKYKGPFISYINYMGKAHIDAIDLGQSN